MKKRLTVTLAIAMVFCVLFAVPAQAEVVDVDVLERYVIKVGAANYNSRSDSLGSFQYWQKQIDEGLWTGKNRPEPLMGDANIDGKVDAKDALFALHFSINGNVQTTTVASGIKTPVQIQWRDKFGVRYNRGVLSDWGNSQEHWFDYCKFNSPFFADVTKDCVVNSLDALQILKYSVGKAKNFPVGQFNSLTIRFSYYPWYTEYTPGYFDNVELINMTNEEFCEKYHFEYDVTPTDK